MKSQMRQPDMTTWGQTKAWLLRWAYNQQERDAINSVQRSDDEPVAFVQEVDLCCAERVQVPEQGVVVYAQECGYDLFLDGKGVVGSYGSRGHIDVTVGHRIDLPEEAEWCSVASYID